MAGQDFSDRIRDLIEESDRVRREGERVRRHAEDAMKSPFWPERRRSTRFPSNDQPRDRKDSA